LPQEFEDTGLYENQAKIAAAALGFRVLAHAEVEAYFEDRVLEVAASARAAWEQRARVTRVALSLLAFSGREMAMPPPSLEPPTENKRKVWPALLGLNERFSPQISAFNHYVRHENHGVKEKNLLALLLPIGVDHTRLDPTFMADVESFGSVRGQAAHTSSGALRQAVDPQQEFKRVMSLLPGIEAIDVQLDELVEEMLTA
jgi:hypothetical protein